MVHHDQLHVDINLRNTKMVASNNVMRIMIRINGYPGTSRNTRENLGEFKLYMNFG